MDNIIGNISEGEKQILKSLTPLVIVIILFILVGKFGISQVSNLRLKINEAKKTQSLLTEKLDLLRSISVISPDSADLVVFALPKSNPTLQVMSQIEILASENSVTLTEMRSSSANSDSDRLSVTTSFNITGTRDTIVAFIKGIDGIAPLTFVEKMSLTENAGLNVAEVSVKTYYAPLPKTIPTVTQSIADLSPSEMDLFNQISQLSQPLVGEVTTISTEGNNLDPFGI
jgi:hypothetical protein